MSSSPTVTVVVATHNREERLRQLLDGLRAQTHRDFEVIIVDDGSTDGTPRLLAEAVARGDLALRTLRQDPAQGPAVARNRGWRAGTTDLIAFTDDDCVPTEGWLAALLAPLRSGREVIVQGRTEPNVAEREHLNAYAKTVSITGPSPHFETCNIAYPRAVLERIGGFDENYPAPAGEDGDLGWRAKAAGAAALFEPEALVYHAVHPGTPMSMLKLAMMAEHGVQSYKNNPGLRATLTQGIFYERSHALMAQGAIGLWLARRQKLALIFAIPYILNVRTRARGVGGGLKTVPYLATYDVIQVFATIRGAVKHRFPVL